MLLHTECSGQISPLLHSFISSSHEVPIEIIILGSLGICFTCGKFSTDVHKKWPEKVCLSVWGHKLKHIK